VLENDRRGCWQSHSSHGPQYNLRILIPSNNLHYDEEASPGSTSFPLPLVAALGIIGIIGAVVGGDDDVSIPFGCSVVGPGVLVNCQAGIEGLPKSGNGEEGVLDTVGPRLSKRALRDFNSCCNSARDWFCDSLFFSIIYMAA
jgi:hypothetical protein